MMKKGLYNAEETKVDVEFANLAFGMVYQLLISSVLTSNNYDKPQVVGDWCLEISSVFNKDIKNLGILREITPDGYIIETVFGQMVTWTNCRMRKIPSSLVNMEDFHKLLSIIRQQGSN